MSKTQYIIGSVSSGTMREEDLIPAFMDALESLDSKAFEYCKEELDALNMEDMETVSDFLNETLWNKLDACALPYFYFGSHPGDGADYGFWLSENFERAFVVDDGGLKVNDTSEVPADYTGEVLHVSDHGNPTLYSAEKGKLTEVWSLV